MVVSWARWGRLRKGSALAALFLTGCTAVDTIAIPRAQTAYLVGRLEPQLREACGRGTLDAATCTQLREAGEALKTRLFEPPRPRLDREALFSFLSVLVIAPTSGVQGGGAKP